MTVAALILAVVVIAVAANVLAVAVIAAARWVVGTITGRWWWGR